ncbi:hypothetical protein [Streptomyces xiamenensis]|uniref:hypothetical protein n=1 Tax=Streptomyces xiamenensis TaxID=408015 RepID=UPI0035E1186D
MISSTVAAEDVDGEYREELEQALHAAHGVGGNEVRETYSLDDIGQKEYHIALLPYTEPSGAHRWAVLESGPTESDWADTDDLDEALATYERAVYDATRVSEPDIDEAGNELPVWAYSDVAGVHAKEEGDPERGISAAREVDAVWAHEAVVAQEKLYKAALERRQIAFARFKDAYGRGAAATLALRVNREWPTVKKITDSGHVMLAENFRKTFAVDCFEDNAGGLFLRREGDSTLWALEGLDSSFDGKFAPDMEAWRNGDWEGPNENDGQTPLYGEEVFRLERIARWSTAKGLEITRLHGQPVAGGAGRAYLGIADED